MKKLIGYGMTPPATGLEYNEIRDLEAHPEKKECYDKLVKIRLRQEKETRDK